MTAADPRLVRLITRLNIGGPARQALLLSRALRGWTTVLGAGTPRDDEGELTHPEVPIRRLPLVRPLDPRADAAALRAVRALLSETRPDLVHTHMAKAGTIGRAAAMSLPRRPLLVHTFHGHVLEGYFRPGVQAAFVRAERALARRTDLLIAVSDEVRDDLLDLGIGTPEQYRVVPLGLELGAHRAVTGRSGALRDELGLDDTTALVGVVGRLVPIKDVRLALDVMRQVGDAHLAVVGDGEQRQELEAIVAADAELAGRVHFTGWRLDVPAVMADLDVALLTSRNEGTPVALIEAAACGRPAVATDVGGVRTVVADGETGFVVGRDAALLASAVERLLGDDALRGRFGEAARERSWRFESGRLVEDIEAAYTDLRSRR